MARALKYDEHKEMKNESTEPIDTNIYVDDQNVYAVEKILSFRSRRRKIEYLVKWKGYSAKHNQWVASTDVTPDLKESFQQQLYIERERKKLKKAKRLKPTSKV